MFGYIFDTDNKYKYENQRLNADTFADVLVAIYDHDTFTKESVISNIQQIHQQKNGDCTNTNWEALFQTAINSVLQGYLIRMDNRYKLSYASTDDIIDDMEWDRIEEVEIPKEISCDRIIGTGTGAVYVYYYDTHKDYYMKNGYLVWPCKIGMSNTDPMKRIFKQVADILSKYPYKFYTCAEPELAKYGKYGQIIECGCISEQDLKILELNIPDKISVNMQNRNGCLCLSCKTELLTEKVQCPHKCIYCYWKN